KARFRARQRLGAEIDPDAAGRLECREQLAGAAAQFEHALARWNQEPHELDVVGVIGLVDLAPALGLVEARLDLLHQLLLARIGKRKGSGWWREIHEVLGKRGCLGSEQGLPARDRRSAF